MRLGLLIDDYLPHSTRVGAKMMHELAQEIASYGHTPIIITPGHISQTNRLLIDDYDGVTVWRFRNGPTKDIGKIKRAINESLLSVNAWLAIKKQLDKEPLDGVVYYSPSIFFGPLVNKIKNKFNCNSYLILRDLFPQWVIDQGMIGEKSPIAMYFRFFEKINYKAANAIGLMSLKNLELFNSKHNIDTKTQVLFNWASDHPTVYPESFESIRTRFELKDKVIFFYGGNIGHAQDMSNLMRLAVALRNQEKAHFVFVGQGDEVELVKSMINNLSLKNVTYLPSVSQEAFKRLLCEIDVGLFSLARSHTAHNFPGKILGYMVNSLPILGSVNPGNDLMDVVNNSQAGYIFENGQDDELIHAAKLLLDDPKLRLECGKSAYHLLKQSFSVKSAANKILQTFI